LTKTLLIYSVPYFNLGGLELCLGGLSPPNPPVATGTTLWFTVIVNCSRWLNYNLQRNLSDIVKQHLTETIVVAAS